MDKRDYYLEFYELLDSCLHEFLEKTEKKVPSIFRIRGYSIKIPVVTYLFYQLMNQRDYYNKCRKRKKSIVESFANVFAYLERFTKHDTTEEYRNTINITDHPWYDKLSSFQEALLIYVFNQRQLNYLVPIITHLGCPIILLSEKVLIEDIELPDNITAIEIKSSPKRFINNIVIEKKYSLISAYANTLDILLRCLSPKCIICLEGCHYEEQLLATIANSYHIPTICIQQGWPSMIRTGFRHLPFKYYFTWGKNFNSCWQKFNSQPEFIEMGYMYEVEDKSKNTKRNCITFFLQGPLFLSDQSYLSELTNLIKEQAISFPNRIFLVREHPEFQLPNNILAELSHLSNVEIVSTNPLKEILNRSLVVVSHFSSTIMECLVHGAIPLVYDPTTNSRYYPDIELEKLGMIAKTPDEFHTTLTYILENIASFQEHAQNELDSWFSNIGISTLDAMKDFITTLCPSLFNSIQSNYKI